jgi:multidrug efflux pump subunit AcrA (membrane-fusion protein)
METEVDVANAKGLLVPGMFASAVLITQQKADAVSVPVEALSRSGDRATALVVGADNKIEERKVVLGVEDANRVEVLSGLRLGEQVVLGGQDQLRPGQEVRPKVVPSGTEPNKS